MTKEKFKCKLGAHGPTKIGQQISKWVDRDNPDMYTKVCTVCGKVVDHVDAVDAVIHRELSPEVFKVLSTHKYFDVKCRLAFRSDTPDEIYEVLAKDEELFVRQAAATFARQVNVLEQLSKDNDHNVRAQVITNLNTPDEIVKRLENDKSELVRNTVKHRLNGGYNK